MRIKDLKALLSGWDDDLEVSVSIPLHEENPRIELRDIASKHDIGSLPDKTILQILEWNFGQPLGFEHLTLERSAKVEHDILWKLADPGRDAAQYRFTAIHGDYRIYLHTGGSQDTCFGQAYDPRIFLDLEARGLIRKSPWQPQYTPLPHYEITEAGRVTLKTEAA